MWLRSRLAAACECVLYRLSTNPLRLLPILMIPILRRTGSRYTLNNINSCVVTRHFLVAKGSETNSIRPALSHTSIYMHPPLQRFEIRMLFQTNFSFYKFSAFLSMDDGFIKKFETLTRFEIRITVERAL